MMGFVQLLSDAKEIVRTDRRVWSAFGFIVVSISIWSLTSVWRENVAESEVHKGRPPDEPGPRHSIVDFKDDWEEEKKRRAIFKENIDRSVSNLNNQKEEIEWHANRLVDKLNGMTIKVDQIIAGIGEARLAKSKLNERIAKQKSKNPKKVIPVDRSELEMAR